MTMNTFEDYMLDLDVKVCALWCWGSLLPGSLLNRTRNGYIYVCAEIYMLYHL